VMARNVAIISSFGIKRLRRMGIMCRICRSDRSNGGALFALYGEDRASDALSN
jgi:hypothetical protein